MSLTVVSAVHGGGTAASSFGAAFVAPTAGQLEVVFATCPNTITITAPAGEGWTVAVNVNPDRRQYAAWRIVPASPTNNQFTLSGGASDEYCQLLITGHDPTTPIADAQGTSSATSSSSIVAPSATAPKGGSLLLNQFMQLATASPGTITPPGGQSTLDSGSVANGYNAVWTSEVVGSGATGTRTATSTISQPTGGISLIVNPATVVGSMAVSGAGSLAFGGGPAGALAASGSGSLALSGVPVTVMAVAGSGALALATVTVSAGGSLAVAGSGTLALAGTPKLTGSLSRSGSGALALGGKPTLTGALALTGAGVLAIRGWPIWRFSSWDGAQWVQVFPKVWDGTQWREDIQVTVTPSVV